MEERAFIVLQPRSSLPNIDLLILLILNYSFLLNAGFSERTHPPFHVYTVCSKPLGRVEVSSYCPPVVLQHEASRYSAQHLEILG